MLAVLRFLWPYARPHTGGLILAGLGLVASTGLGLLRPWPMKFLFDLLVFPTTSPSTLTLLLVLSCGAIVVLAAVDGLFGYIKQYFLLATAQKVAFGLRVAVFAQLQRLSLTFYAKQRTGDLITRATADVAKLHDLITDDLLNAISRALVLTGMVGIMLWMDWQLTLMVLTVLPLLFFTIARYRERIQTQERRLRSKEGEIASITQETLTSIKVVKAYGREDYETGRFQHETQEALEAGLLVSRLEARFGWMVDVSTAVGTAAVLYLGAQRVLAGSLTPGDLLVFAAYIKDFYSPLRTLSKLTTKLSKAQVRLERVAELFREQPGVQEHPKARRAPRFQGRITFEDVSFSYDPERPILQRISFTIPPGRTLGIVGLTGAGKSTLVSLIPRLHDPSAGRVLIDGDDVRAFTLASLREQISLVLQETLLFGATIAQNIAYGRPDATGEEIVAAAKQAGAHEFITALPHGYATVVGERGSTLSGGQRQLIALARALIRRAPILILDEPTTGLDAAAEEQVLAALERAAGPTTVIISHKIAAVRRADLILVLEGSQIIQQGTHAALLAAGGLYRRLYLTQTGEAPLAAQEEPTAVAR
ncbi:MAG: ABC transporter ATP-binding protein [Chloroflexi bacterium]|nr:ABC transporter ATP-binding protein [Chloroflexota bacterium]